MPQLAFKSQGGLKMLKLTIGFIALFIGQFASAQEGSGWTKVEDTTAIRASVVEALNRFEANCSTVVLVGTLDPLPTTEHILSVFRQNADWAQSVYWTRAGEQPMIAFRADSGTTEQMFYMTTSADKRSFVRLDARARDVTTKRVNTGTIDNPVWQDVEEATRDFKIVCQ